MSADDYLDDDEEDRSSTRSFVSSGWFRALLLLGALGVVLAVGLPYLLRWLDFSPSSRAQVAAPEQPAPAPPAAVGSASPAPAAPPGAASLPSGATRDTTPKPATASPAGKPEPVAPTAAPPRVASAPGIARRDSSGGEAARRTAAKREPETTEALSAAPRAGDYWIQVGSFQDGRNAERVATTLREAKLPVRVERVTRGATGASQHEVLVTGATVDAVTEALRGAATARAVPGGVAVQPPLDLKEAVALSRRLAREGLSVRIRRVRAAEGATLHIVRVGPFPSRTWAEAARKDVVATGVGGFVAQGPAR